jgi:uncharacterized protein (TIGR02118 family)
MANIGRMSVSYFVRYDITTKDTAAFLRYFRDVHVPLATRWPGLKGVVLHTPTEWNDPYAITRGNSVLLVQFEFDSAAALNRALFSPEREQTRLNFQNFPAFAGTVTHQALATETVWTKK